MIDCCRGQRSRRVTPVALRHSIPKAIIRIFCSNLTRHDFHYSKHRSWPLRHRRVWLIVENPTNIKSGRMPVHPDLVFSHTPSTTISGLEGDHRTCRIIYPRVDSRSDRQNLIADICAAICAVTASTFDARRSGGDQSAGNEEDSDVGQ